MTPTMIDLYCELWAARLARPARHARQTFLKHPSFRFHSMTSLLPADT
jgi:hypothetical protein